MPNVFTQILLLLLFFSSAEMLKAQQIESVVSENIKFTTSAFQEGTYISVRIIFPKDKEKIDVKFTFPEGIEYAEYALVKNSAIREVTPKDISQPNSPILTILSRPGSKTYLLLKRKITLKGYNILKTRQSLQDEVSVMLDNITLTSKKSNEYFLNTPLLHIIPQKVKETLTGAYLRTFAIDNKPIGEKNVGIINNVYFSVKHPLGVKTQKVLYEKKELTPIAKVPQNIGENRGEDLYVINIPKGLKKGKGVLITEEYTAKGCTAEGEVTYEAYWGENPFQLYEVSSAVETITMQLATDETPNVVLNPKSTATYFKWNEGFCGNILGMFTAQYVNKGNSPAYNLQLTLYEEEQAVNFKTYKPTNFRIISNEGKEISIPDTMIQMPNGRFGERVINFTNSEIFKKLALKENNIGLTDEDGDGLDDDLAPEGKINIRFDLIRENDIPCLLYTEGIFSVNPVTEISYKTLCGDSFRKKERLNDYTFKRKVKELKDTSVFPTLLQLNQPVSASISFTASVTSQDNVQQLQSQRKEIAQRKFCYEISLPKGVAMKNVKFYNTYPYETSVVPIMLPDVPSGDTFSYTTANEVYGYVTFDIVLTTCKANNISLQYTVWQMDKNRYNSYCKIPYICMQKIINTECPNICFKNAPKTLSTTIERADSSYGWTDNTMSKRQLRTKVTQEDRKRALYLDDIEVISDGIQLGETSKNLYYYMRVPSTVSLLPKQISLKMGEHSIALVAKEAILNQTADTTYNYFLWNLTEALPSQGLLANDKFTVIATYQVQSHTAQEVTTITQMKEEVFSFFYRLNDTEDQNVNERGYHTAELHCGKESKSLFYLVTVPNEVTYTSYKIKGCAAFTIRNITEDNVSQTTTATIFTDEYRPKKLAKTIAIKVPNGYNLVKPVTYHYLENTVSNIVYIPLKNFAITNDKDFKTYTYVNPKRGADGYLPPEAILGQKTNTQYIELSIQPSCESKVYTNEKEAFNNNQLVSIEVTYEDAYYHYVSSGNQEIIRQNTSHTLLYTGQPSIALQSLSNQNIKIHNSTFLIDFTLQNSSETLIPNTWLRIPNIEGIKILRLLEIDPITQKEQRVIPAQDVQGEKYYFLNQLKAHINKVYRFEYQVDNYNMTSFTVEVYAGSSCDDTPVECNMQKLVYNVEKIKETAPNIVVVAQPKSQEVCDEKKVIFTSVAQLNSTNVVQKMIAYQWQELPYGSTQWRDIDTEKGSIESGDRVTLLLNTISVDLNGNKYRVKYTYANEQNTIIEYSEIATLKVNYLNIEQQPLSDVYIQKTPALPLYVKVYSTTKPVYQWYESMIDTNTNSKAVGLNMNTYTPSTEEIGERYYYVTITDKCGTITSSVAKIEVKSDTFTTTNETKRITVYNGLSVNGDGKNDYFYIEGIENYQDNKVRLYNRAGEKVFEIKGYNNVSRIFKGDVPSGTYYYIIEYYDSFQNKQTQIGWLYIQK